MSDKNISVQYHGVCDFRVNNMIYVKGSEPENTPWFIRGVHCDGRFLHVSGRSILVDIEKVIRAPITKEILEGFGFESIIKGKMPEYLKGVYSESFISYWVKDGYGVLITGNEWNGQRCKWFLCHNKSRSFDVGMGDLNSVDELQNTFFFNQRYELEWNPKVFDSNND